MREESWLYRLLRWLGFIKSYEVSKKKCAGKLSPYAISNAVAVRGTNKRGQCED